MILTVDFKLNYRERASSMNVECHDDCNAVSKRTAAKEHVIRMLYLDHVDCNVVSRKNVVKEPKCWHVI